MKLVVAANQEEFYSYCRENALNPNSRPRTVRYLQGYNDFFGVEAGELILYGNWRESEIYKDQELWNFMINFGEAGRWDIPSELKS